MTWDTFLTLRGTKVIYLDYVGRLRPSSPEAKFLFPFLGPGLWTGTWPWACQFLFETDRRTDRQTQAQVQVLSCASQLKTVRQTNLDSGHRINNLSLKDHFSFWYLLQFYGARPSLISLFNSIISDVNDGSEIKKHPVHSV